MASFTTAQRSFIGSTEKEDCKPVARRWNLPRYLVPGDVTIKTIRLGVTISNSRVSRVKRGLARAAAVHLKRTVQIYDTGKAPMTLVPCPITGSA